MEHSTLRSSTQPPALPKRKYPIKVVCVVKRLEDAGDTTLQTIKTFAIESNVLYESRIYDSYADRHDRDEIERLPAYHIYVNSIYQSTFYPNGRPIQIIQQTVEQYLQRIESNLARKGRYKHFLKTLLHRVKLAFHKKTRMEIVHEEEKRRAQESIRRKSMDFDRRMSVTMHDWD